MNAQTFLDAADRLPLVGLETLLGDGGAVILAPHPDDESLGCGALIAAATAAGREVRVAIFTDGVGSHPGSKAYPPARLRALRENEVREAVKKLGLLESHVLFLGLPDRAAPSRGLEASRAASVIVRLCHETHAGALFVT